ncbi:MAG: response regulator, partial [Thermoguttaceae bacterium]
MKTSILLVDDEPSFLESTAELLRNDGHRCDTAEDAHRADELLASQWYDLLISDIRMNGNKNLEFIERAQLMRPGLPIILVTGYPSTETAISSIHLPVVAYLRKPLQYGELQEHVRRALTQSEAFRTVAQAQERLRQIA